MRCIRPKDLSFEDINVQEVEIFPEIWNRQREFSRYRTTPRPTSALFLICPDILVTFYPENGEPIVGTKGDVIYIPKGICYHAAASGNQNQGATYTVNFTLRAEEEILLSEQIAKIATFTDGRFATAAEQLHRAVYHFEQDGRRNFIKIKSAFFSLLDLVTEAASDEKDIHYLIRPAVRALQEEWNQNIKVADYAALCGISPAYFYRCFKEWSGKSPVEYRNRLRLTNAADLLCHTDMTVSEIAEMVGFEDAFYFCRVFTNCFHLSPQKYRRMKNTE